MLYTPNACFLTDLTRTRNMGIYVVKHSLACALSAIYFSLKLLNIRIHGSFKLKRKSNFKLFSHSIHLQRCKLPSILKSSTAVYICYIIILNDIYFYVDYCQRSSLESNDDIRLFQIRVLFSPACYHF